MITPAYRIRIRKPTFFRLGVTPKCAKHELSDKDISFAESLTPSVPINVTGQPLTLQAPSSRFPFILFQLSDYATLAEKSGAFSYTSLLMDKRPQLRNSLNISHLQ